MFSSAQRARGFEFTREYYGKLQYAKTLFWNFIINGTPRRAVPNAPRFSIFYSMNSHRATWKCSTHTHIHTDITAVYKLITGYPPRIRYIESYVAKPKPNKPKHRTRGLPHVHLYNLYYTFYIRKIYVSITAILLNTIRDDIEIKRISIDVYGPSF